MKIVYGLHLMWYETDMLEEHLDSLDAALSNLYVPVDVEFILCANHQTYIEQPDDSEFALSLATRIWRLSEKYKNSNIPEPIWWNKAQFDPFYNIGDFRRDTYKRLDDNGYLVWGEVDALIPDTYFAILGAMAEDPLFDHPHVLTFASRKMWDSTWTMTEHTRLQARPREHVPPPFRYDDYITQQELDEYNRGLDPTIVQLPTVKLDGALVSLRNGLPQHIPDDMHFAREDFIAQEVFNFHGIPQYHVSNVLKGHNYNHPKKRVGTSAKRTDDIYKKYEAESFQTGMRFLQGLTR